MGGGGNGEQEEKGKGGGRRLNEGETIRGFKLTNNKITKHLI